MQIGSVCMKCQSLVVSVYMSPYEYVTDVFQMRTITKTRLFKYIENFTTKNWKFSD